ncbi:hypothetical protein CHUAL_011748 [Chamberlinius hualienensis]
MEKIGNEDKKKCLSTPSSPCPYDLISIKQAFNSLVESSSSIPLFENFKLLSEVFPDLIQTQVRKKVGRVWVTDACHMADCKKLVLSTNIRTLRFYDISAIVHLEEFLMYGISSNATCLHYHFETEMQSTDNGSYLFFGDNRGYIHCLQFKQQHNGLFKKLDIEKTTKDLQSHRDYVNYQLIDRNHKTAILQIKFIPQNYTLISCSEGYLEPLVVRDMRGYLKMYVFRQPKELKLWDLVYHHCIQTITMKFPIDLFSLYTEPEHPNRPIYLQTFQGNSILIQCRDYVFQLQKSRKQIVKPVIEITKELSVKQPTNTPVNEEQNLSERYKNGSLTELLDDGIPLPTVATIISSNPHLLDSEGLPILVDQFFSQENIGVNRKEMKNGVLRGLPFSTLKVIDVDPVPARINLPRLIDNGEGKTSIASKRLDLLSVNCIPKNGASINYLSTRRSSLAINGSLVTHLPLIFVDNAGKVGTQNRRSSKAAIFNTQ